MARSPRDRTRTQATPEGGHRRRLGRLALLLVGLEIALRIPPLPAWWEAGIWSGNIWSDRVWAWLISRGHPDTDARGYRHLDWSPPGTRPRVVVMGDSRVYGHYVDATEAFPHVMTLEAKRYDGGWEAVNLGLPGASVVEALDFIADDALGLEPVAAILCYDVNSSLYGVMSREDAGGRDDWPVQLLRSSAILRWTELGLRAALVERHPVMPVQSYEDQMVALMEKLEAGGVEHQVVLVGWTQLRDYPTLFTGKRYAEFRQASRDAAWRAGAGVIEMERVFATWDPDEVFIGHERMHLSPAAHRALAEAALRALGDPPAVEP